MANYASLIVSNHTIVNVLNAIKLYEKVDNLQELYEEVYKLNIRAVNHRYSEKNRFKKYIVEDVQQIFTTETNKQILWDEVTTYLYQCSEGDFPNTSLYQIIEGIALKLEKELGI